MPKTIVVPLDESENAERALPIAVTLAGQLNAQLLLVSVYEVHPEYAQWAGDYIWETEAYLARITSRLRSLTVSTLVVTGVDPAIEIDEVVSGMDDTLVVMSTQGRSGIKRLVLGSKTTRILQLATYPVVIVPVDCADFAPSVSRIFLPLDGSTFAEHALQVTCDLFAEANPAFYLLRVVDEVWVKTHVEVALQKELIEEASHYLHQIGESLEAEGFEVSSEVQESLDIADTIATGAEQTSADLIAMATHGRSGFSRFFLGSVADAVLRTARIPVLVIRPPEAVVARASESRSEHGAGSA